MHSEGAAELLGLRGRESPAKIESAKAGLAAQKKARAQAKAKPKAQEGDVEGEVQ